MIEQQAHRLSEAIGAILTKMLHDLIEQARFVSVGVGHFGFVLFAKTSKPIWPAPATPDPIFRPFYAAAFATLRLRFESPKIGITDRWVHRLFRDLQRCSGDLTRCSEDLTRC